MPESKKGWDIIEMDGQQVGIRTSAIDEKCGKCQAFETLVIYYSTPGGRFAPYLQQSLKVVLQSSSGGSLNPNHHHGARFPRHGSGARIDGNATKKASAVLMSVTYAIRPPKKQI